MSCIFCRIVNKEVSAEILFEDKNLIVIKDINPKSKVHLLILPKVHIDSVADIETEQIELMGRLIFTAKMLAKEKGISGYKLQFNVGRAGGQEVFHLHLHFMA